MAFLNDLLRPFTTRLGLKGGWRVATLTGNAVLTLKSEQIQVLDPGGSSRNVTLPAVRVGDDGYGFGIYNSADAAENLVVKNPAGSTLATIPRGGFAAFYVTSAGAWALGFMVDVTLTGGGEISKAAQPTGGIASAVIAGGAAGAHTVTGIASGDELIFVGHVAGAGSDVTDFANLTSEFSVTGADTIDNTGGTSSASGKLFVLYFDRT